MLLLTITMMMIGVMIMMLMILITVMITEKILRVIKTCDSNTRGSSNNNNHGINDRMIMTGIRILMLRIIVTNFTITQLPRKWEAVVHGGVSQWLDHSYSSGSPARGHGVSDRTECLMSCCQYTETLWDSKFDVQLLSQCGNMCCNCC